MMVATQACERIEIGMTTKIRDHHREQKSIGMASIEQFVAAAAKPAAMVADRTEGGRRRKGVNERPEQSGGYRLVMSCHVVQDAFNQ
jgi:hypothetical protein